MMQPPMLHLYGKFTALLGEISPSRAGNESSRFLSGDS